MANQTNSMRSRFSLGLPSEDPAKTESRLLALADFARSSSTTLSKKQEADLAAATSSKSKYASKKAAQAGDAQIGTDDEGFEVITSDLQVFSILGESFTLSIENAILNADTIAKATKAKEVDVGALLKKMAPVFLLSELRARKNAAYAPDFYVGSNDFPVSKVFPGLIPVIGGTGAGKTTYLKTKAKVDIIIRCSEPAESVDVAGAAIGARSIDQALSLAISFSLAGYRVAIDSLRKLVYTNSGGAGTLEGGISGGLYDALTTISNILVDTGVTIFAAINPLAKKDVMETLFTSVASSTAGALFIENSVATKSTFRLEDGRFFSGGVNSIDDLPDPQVSLSVLVNSNRLSKDNPNGKVPAALVMDLSTGLEDEDDSARPSKPRVMPIAQF
jgi:hypothetical protein